MVEMAELTQGNRLAGHQCPTCGGGGVTRRFIDGLTPPAGYEARPEYSSFERTNQKR